MFRSLSRWLLFGFFFFFLLSRPTPLWAQAALENPQSGSSQSGIGTISGWKCTATTVDFVIDGRITVQAAYGTIRGDTQNVCGDNNNGFGLLVNWNLLGAGQHTLVARADGVEFARSTFTVTSLGADFLRGVTGQYQLPGFPTPNTDVTVKWEESLQSFVIAGVTTSPTPQTGYRVQGIEQYLLCSDRSIVTFSGILTGSPTNGAVRLFYNTGVEVNATLVGIQNISGIVAGNFFAEASVNGRVVSQSQGVFHGIVVGPNVNLNYTVAISSTGCRAYGTLSGSQ